MHEQQREDQSELPPLEQVVAELVAWFARNGLAGFDPYDVYDRLPIRLARRMAGTRLNRVWAQVDRSAQRQPMRVRRLLGQKPHENSKTVGLLLGSWVQLTRAGLEPYPADGAQLVAWLDAHRHRGYPGASWSYPFGYQSRMYFPAGTPWGIVTAICGEALLDYAELTGNDLARDLAHRAARFIAEAVPLVPAGTGAYLTYTPVDDFSIHNASLSMGAFLARAAASFEAPAWAERADRVLRFTLSEQLGDGAFDYWAAHQSTRRHVDNYHTGFVLRALHGYACLGYEGADAALQRGWRFYAQEFVSADGYTRTYEGLDVPVNIHGCAESILCGAALAGRFPDAINLARCTFAWTTQNLRNADGSFGYGIFSYGYQPMAYTRWGEAWMLRALSELAEATSASATPTR